MTTKFRSACDRCHDAKVRCSGDMPCQGCVVSKNLCFYSVSNVLGRPRGTKNKTSRRKTNTNNTSDRHGISEGDHPAIANERGGPKKAASRRRKTKEDGSDTVPPNTVMSENDDYEAPSLVSSGLHTPTDNMWFPLPQNGSHGFGISNTAPPANFRLDCFSPIEPATPILSHTPPSIQTHYETSLDINMSDFPALDDSDPAYSFPWDHTISCAEPPKAMMDPALTLPSPKNDDVTQLVNTTHKMAYSQNCTCLQQHAELLSNPNIAEMNACAGSDDTVLSLDKALSLAKQGMRAWRSLIECHNCPYNNDQEVMLLALMSIRPVTRYLQRLAPRYMARPRPDSEASGSTRASPIESWPSKESCRLMLGTLEVEDDERILVYRLLLQKTVQKVRQTLHALQTIQYKRKKQLLAETSNRTAGTEDYHASSSLLHIQQMTHALATALQTLESSLNSAE